MEPRIQYAKTSDGVSIAYAFLGEGPLIVFASNIWGSLHMSCIPSGPSPATAINGLVDFGWSVALYDGRGSGSSDRDVADLSLDARPRDLNAVAARLTPERFPLAGISQGTITAMVYATNHQERVSHLVLVNPFATGAEYYATLPAMGLSRAMKDMAEDQWEFFTLSLASAVIGFRDSAEAATMAAAFRAGMSAANFLRFRDASETIDIRDVLPKVSMPTLVIHDDTTRVGSTALAKSVASAIPNAHFLVTNDLPAAITEFVSGRPARRRVAQRDAHAAVQTILFTDIEGSTALTDRLGDTAAREVVRGQERITREALKAHGGSEVKTMGDGFMASFGSATKALECAVAIQKAFDAPETAVGAQSLALLSSETPIRVRIGLNAGEPIAEDDPGGRGDLFGTAVIVAARIAARANGGEILVSDVVRQLVAGKGFLFNDRGDHALKGFEDPVRVFEVRWREG